MRCLLLILTIVTFFSTQLNAQNIEPEKNEEIVQPFTFLEITELIKEVFPEAYENFVEVSFYRTSNFIFPGTAIFLIPTRFFENNSLNIDVLKQRTEDLLLKMDDAGGCEEVSIGESKEYSWHAWEDKVVTKVTITFFIGC